MVILTTFDLDDYVYEALRAGASGFLLKDAPRADLVAAVRVAAAGDALLAPSVTRRLIEAFAARPAAMAPVTVPAGVADPARAGHPAAGGAGPQSNAEIASDLVVSEATVKTHVAASAGQARPARPGAGGHPRLRNGCDNPWAA